MAIKVERRGPIRILAPGRGVIGVTVLAGNQPDLGCAVDVLAFDFFDPAPDFGLTNGSGREVGEEI